MKSTSNGAVTNDCHWRSAIMVWIILVIAVIVLFFLKDTGRMKRMQSEIRAAYTDQGLTYDDAEKVGWYLIDIFIYMRKNKNPKLAKIVMNSTMTIYRQRLYDNSSYAGQLSAQIQVDGIRDARLIFNRPVNEAADLIYTSVVASYEDYLKQKR